MTNCPMSTSDDSSRSGELDVKSRVLVLLSELDTSERGSLEQWISSTHYRQDLLKLKSFKEEEEKLKKIASKLRKELPLKAELPTEKILVPATGDLADCLEVNTSHLDEFLYDDDDVDNMVKKGKISRHYCVSCGSRNTKELNFISHSMSRRTQLYVFKVLLPQDLSGLQLLDIGSRIGAVLYGAYYFTNTSKIVGVEMNEELCEIQRKVISSCDLDPSRIKIINSDIMNERATIENSNIIIMNVFDFFVDTEKQIQMWNFFKSAMKKGTRLVTVRSVAETLSSLGVYENFLDWLIYAEPQQTENEMFFNAEDSDYGNIYSYTVK